MFSVFSNKINLKPSERIRLAEKCAGGLLTRDLIAGPIDEPLYMLKPDVIEWLKWINKKILFSIPKDNMYTIGVRIRIATGMLNNFQKDGTLPKEICLAYHERLVNNANRLVSLVNTEDLPF